MIKNKSFLFVFLLAMPYLSNSSQPTKAPKGGWQAQKKEAAKTAKNVEKKIKTRAAKGEEGTIRVLQSQLDGSWGYDKDDTNFISPKNKKRAALQGEIPSVRKVTTKPIVLVNSHGTDELYLGKAISGNFVPGKHRSLNWACSLEDADAMIKHQLALHESLALPLSWSGNKYRTRVTFTVIPAGTEIEFKKGTAAAQKIEADPKKNVAEEYRPGGGEQIRMKYIPANAITITKKLLPDEKTSMREQKTMKSINFRQLLEDGINEYNEMYPHLQQFDAKQLAKESYYRSNFEDSLSGIEERMTAQEQTLSKGLTDSDTDDDDHGMERSNASDFSNMSSEEEEKQARDRKRNILLSSRNETDSLQKTEKQRRTSIADEQENQRRELQLQEHNIRQARLKGIRERAEQTMAEQEAEEDAARQKKFEEEEEKEPERRL